MRIRKANIAISICRVRFVEYERFFSFSRGHNFGNTSIMKIGGGCSTLYTVLKRNVPETYGLPARTDRLIAYAFEPDAVTTCCCRCSKRGDMNVVTRV